jgi:hypothetical protein
VAPPDWPARCDDQNTVGVFQEEVMSYDRLRPDFLPRETPSSEAIKGATDRLREAIQNEQTCLEMSYIIQGLREQLRVLSKEKCLWEDKYHNKRREVRKLRDEIDLLRQAQAVNEKGE